MSSASSNDEAMVRLVFEMARGLVGDSDDIRVDVHSDSTSRSIRLRVGRGDSGKLLGSHGRTAKSIRTIWQLRVIDCSNDTLWILLKRPTAACLTPTDPLVKQRIDAVMPCHNKNAIAECCISLEFKT